MDDGRTEFDLSTHGRAEQALPPVPRLAVAIRAASVDDLPFIDALQRKHSAMVGWMPTKQLQRYIEQGNVLVAEERLAGAGEVENAEEASPVQGTGASPLPLQPLPPELHRSESRAPGSEPGGRESPGECRSVPLPCNEAPALSRAVGYIIAKDQYFKRDDCGIVYQVNVAAECQRGLIGAALVQAVFERAAYGCKLFCCWCAQDIEANRFWESLGFVPLAFRAGSRGRKRVHIFWQRRVRAGDVETPYWFPARTSAGAIREDRLVFPIPPGTRWSDAMPMILPAGVEAEAGALEGERGGALGEARGGRIAGHGNDGKSLAAPGEGGLRNRTRRKGAKGKQAPVRRMTAVERCGLRFGPPAEFAGHAGATQPGATCSAPSRAEPTLKPRRERMPRLKCDPAHVAKARELRDLYLDEVNGGRMLPASWNGKYDVGRQLEAAGRRVVVRPMARLEAA